MASERQSLLLARKTELENERNFELNKFAQLKMLYSSFSAGAEVIVDLICKEGSLLTADQAAGDLLGAKLVELARTYHENNWKQLFEILDYLLDQQLFPDVVLAVLDQGWLRAIAETSAASTDCEHFLVWLLAFCSHHEKVVKLVQEQLTALIVYSLFNKKMLNLSLLELYMAVPCQKQFSITVTACLDEVFASEEALHDLDLLRHAQPWFPYANSSSSLRQHLTEIFRRSASLTERINQFNAEIAMYWCQLFGVATIVEIIKESAFVKYERMLQSFIIKSEAEYATLQILVENWLNITRAFAASEPCDDLSERILNLVNQKLDCFNFVPKADSAYKPSSQILSSTFSDVLTDRCSTINAHCSFGTQTLSGVIPVKITCSGKSYNQFQILDDVLYVKKSDGPIPISVDEIQTYL